MEDGEALEALLDHTLDKVSVLDEEGVYTYANAAVGRLLGHDPEALVGESALQYVHPDDRDRVEAAFKDIVGATGDRTGTIEYRYRTADGDYRWLESRLSNATADALDGYVVSSRDVTDRTQAERRRRETEDRMARIAEKSNDVLWMFTGTWDELLFVNDAVEPIYGVTPARLREDSRAFIECIHPDDRPRVVNAMEYLSEGRSVDMEYRVNEGEGFRRWVWVQGEPVFEDGEVTEVVGFSRDVTGRRRREQHLKTVDHLLRHNLRNDMTIIQGHADLARELEGDEREACLDQVVEVSEDLLETVEKERKVVRVLTESPVAAPVDVASGLRGAAVAVRNEFPAAEVTVDAPESLVVRTLPSVVDAAAELVENAAEHGPADGATVHATARRSADGAELTVRDDGPPIPGSELDVVSGDREMDQLHHGSGLGLWLVYWVVDVAGGDVTFERPDGGGNLVRVELPDS